MSNLSLNQINKNKYEELTHQINSWAQELGFQDTAITDIDLRPYLDQLKDWLSRNFHGDMDYMESNVNLRADPSALHPGTVRVICVRMDYMTEECSSIDVLDNSAQAYIAHYARGRDYHKVMRKKLQKLAIQIQGAIGPFGYRAFVDSAPVLERALAEKSGLGWIGKNTMLINKNAGSWFFLGELFTDLPLPINKPVSNHCGTCHACLDICPTNAFTAPNQLDARRCISYLTIESRTSIPIEFRSAIGNRIFGCDDCQLICPWNKFAKSSPDDHYRPRNDLDNVSLIKLFRWSETEFLSNTEGSPIRRIGYECWLRNIAVALGNAPTGQSIVKALEKRRNHYSPLVKEHVEWAIEQHTSPQPL
ncbi:tRNA epoxyqueuosine(34) reductase QueG [OM182 bacterium]|nr:tRNA epoxyqueuosine(34) reductase QueG [OM182 bacterium]